MRDRIRKLLVIYDDRCEFCAECRRWLENEPAFIPMEFVPARSERARVLLQIGPSIPKEAGEELYVIDDHGGVYKGSSAFLICLYALKEYRELSIAFSSPALQPYARAALEMVSSRRRKLSAWFFGRARTHEEIEA